MAALYFEYYEWQPLLQPFPLYNSIRFVKKTFNLPVYA